MVIKMSVKTLIRPIAFLALAFIIVPSAVFSQFGQNKVQYNVFDWKYLQSKHFDVFFAQNGESIARFTANAAESSLVSLEKNIGYRIKNRIPIIVFNSHNEFQQNNAVDEYLPEGVGGVTELLKNRVLVPFEGDYEKFRHVIHHELLHAYMNDLYYGGSLQNIISQNIQLQIPTWFNEGMAEYQSLGGNDRENDMFIRDAVIYDYIPPVDYLYGYIAYRGGQSFFSWLSDEYGQEKIGDLMMQIKALGDVNEGFEDVYKLSLEKLSDKWLKFLKQTYWPDYTGRQEITDFAKRITDSKNGDGYYNTAPTISPDGKRIIYISNRDDYFAVFLAEVKSGKVIKKLISGTSTPDFEELHLLAPGLCWSPDGKKFAISVKSGSRDAVYVVDIESRDETELPIKFDGIFNLSWNPTYNLLVLRGDNSTQSDIWLYNIKTKKLEQITNDLYTDLDPTWSHDGTKIFFSSDRGDNTELNNIPSKLKMSDYDYSEKDLYEYDLSTKKLVKFGGTKNSVESHVVMSPDGKKILFLSDRNGIHNIWMRNLETNIEKPITNSLSPIHLMSLSEDGKRLAFSALTRGAYDIFYIENPFEIDLGINELPNTLFFQNKYGKDNNTTSDSNQVNNTDSLAVNSDTSTVNNDSTLYDSTMSVKKNTASLYGNNIQLNLQRDPDSLNTNENNLKLKIKEKDPVFNVSENTNEDGSLKINKYKIKFSPDIIYTNASYSSFYGVQGIVQMAFSDVLGNHRIYAATSLVLDLKNSDYAFAYYYLPKRIDFGVEAYHSARFLLVGNSYTYSQLYRYRQYGANVNMSYPISKFNRIDAALSIARLSKENMDNPLEPEEFLDFSMPIFSYVHDNTIWGYTAPIKGTRYNLTLMGTPKIGRNGINFITGIGDYRTYLKIADDYGFVIRLNAGASLGDDPQKFYIGGTENWINYTVHNDELPITEINDFAFSTPVLPLRGFDYNFRSGSKFGLLNAEFRFPLFRYLIFGALPLAFQNIQGVMFMDAGVVWSDNKKLQLFREFNGSTITNDLLVGMGVGTRVFFMYFPLKFDVAWRYNLQRFSRPIYYISIGADF